MPEDIGTFNHFMVGAKADGLVILNQQAISRPISYDRALNLAAHLIALADPGGDRFAPVLKAILEE